MIPYLAGDPCFEEAVDTDLGGHGNPNRTVSDLDLDECTELKTYDYFEGSEVSFALTFLFAGLWAVGKCTLYCEVCKGLFFCYAFIYIDML